MQKIILSFFLTFFLSNSLVNGQSNYNICNTYSLVVEVGDTAEIDINNDASNDIRIIIFHDDIYGNSIALFSLHAWDNTYPLNAIRFRRNVTSFASNYDNGDPIPYNLTQGETFSNSCYLAREQGINMEFFENDSGNVAFREERGIAYDEFGDPIYLYCHGWIKFLVGDNCETITVAKSCGCDKYGMVAGEALPSVGLSEISEAGITIYPSPATEYITVQSSIQGIYRLYNIAGIPLYEGKIFSEKTVLNVQNLPTGIYFMTIQNEHEFFSQKIQIIK
ncbi:MAG: hypothetical protein POELPBGB_02944 [Bacteroidia bacterium]|nr:hypothetical protein [Bacteroidia bacterium]